MSKQKLVVIGNGMAPGRALEKLFELAPDAYDVTIFNAEPRVNYDRIMLSPVLSGEKTFEEIVIHGDGWYVEARRHALQGHNGHRDRPRGEDRDVGARHDGRLRQADHRHRLACRSSSRCPATTSPACSPIAISTTCRRCCSRPSRAARAVVIGGGLLGLEAAAGLNEQGMDVTVLHLMPTLMERQLDPAAGHLLQKAIEARGIHVITKANTKAILGEKPRRGACCSRTARGCPADLVVMAVGIRPERSARQGRGHRRQSRHRGRRDDAHQRSRHLRGRRMRRGATGQVFGLVAPLYDMAERDRGAAWPATRRPRFKPSATATKLKVTGINLFSAGDFAEAKDREEIVLRDAARGVYKRLVLQGRQADRRGDVRRHRRRRLVLRPRSRRAPTSRECARR